MDGAAVLRPARRAQRLDFGECMALPGNDALWHKLPERVGPIGGDPRLIEREQRKALKIIAEDQQPGISYFRLAQMKAGQLLEVDERRQACVADDGVVQMKHFQLF